MATLPCHQADGLGSLGAGLPWVAPAGVRGRAPPVAREECLVVREEYLVSAEWPVVSWTADDRAGTGGVFLAEGYVDDVDGDRDGIPDRGAVGVADVDPAAGRDHDPVELAVGRRVVHGRAAAQDVD